MIKIRRVSFVWDASKVQGRWYLGLFGFYELPDDDEAKGLAIRTRVLAAWVAGFIVCLYFALATALFWVWQRNTYSVLTYSDALLYPFRRATITEKKGQAFIAQGQELFRAQKWGDAARLLQLGLARYPHDTKARLSLAQFYVLSNQRTVALRWLQEGLTGEYPGRAYLETLFNVAQQAEDYDLIAETAGRYVGQVKREGSPTDLRWLLERRFAALLAAERPAEALAVAEMEAGDTATEHRVLVLLAMGRAAEAVAFLDAWRQRSGVNVSLVVRLQVRAHREAKSFAAMDRALAEYRALAPAEPGPLVYAVVQQAMAGREGAARVALDDFIFRFGGAVENLLLVATPLAEVGDVTLLQRTFEAATERGFPSGRFHSLLVQTHVRRGEWEAAARSLALVPTETGRDAAAAQAWREWMLRLVECARFSTDAARAALVEFLRARPWPLGIYRQTIEALLRARQPEAARDVIAVALRAFPNSKWLRSQSEALTARPADRSPEGISNDPLAAGVRMNEQAFTQRLDELLQAAQWDEAARHLAQAETLHPRPAWLDTREAAIRLASVRIAAGKRDFPGTVAAARVFLNTDETRARQLLDLARSYWEAGDKAYAVALVREISGRLPQLAAAKQALAQWGAGAAERGASAGLSVVAKTIRENPEDAPAPDEPAAWLAEIRAKYASGDTSGGLRLVRLFLNGDRTRAMQMLEVAREYFASGDRATGTTLTNEVLRRTPGFAPAQRLLAEWAAAEKK